MSNSPFATEAHDHRECVHAALVSADGVCARAGVRLTALRREVLELVWQSHRPIGAYAILGALGRTRGRVAPPTVYRALDFLRTHGLVHRIESLNAYVGCVRPESRHETQFLICTECGAAAELDDGAITAALATAAGKLGFSSRQLIVEIAGECPECRSEESGDGP
ncbi:MAG: Fur family transcriptional regulator [Alphaproteobacteria bacterium]